MTVLIISSNSNNIYNILKENTFGHITTALSGNEARRIISENCPDLVIIDSPLPDEFGQELAMNLSEITNVIFLCRDKAENISSFLPSEIVVVTKPFNNEDFRNALKMFPEIDNIKRESNEILVRIDEMRLINRAKCTLMEYLKFTEPQAHRYIEKQAMNNRQTRREVAEKILKTYKK